MNTQNLKNQGHHRIGMIIITPVKEKCSQCEVKVIANDLVCGVCLQCRPEGISELTHVLCDESGKWRREEGSFQEVSPSKIKNEGV